MTTYQLPDNGGRRFMLERRQFTYDFHIPKRRNGEDRRSGLDRREDRKLSKDKEV